ncbi:MAG: hypothetical protein FJZ47_23630 [Candidatus Tectomicrobia bacterium]|uniref:Uncharacterized protein n=1 Tax=Tectimicrobiota bacterium TaxID=2528274 RepID=A0A937W854_UNCTE|nr:hypothetical protein [Candidatus Tectomicrobia bacterium]
MAFSDYKTIAQVQTQFAITYREAYYIHAPARPPAPQFVTELGFSRDYIDIYTSEAARCEAIIFPILREVYKAYCEQYALWIQKPLSYTPDLSGTPDYLIATKSALGKTVLGEPLLLIVEAKKNDFEQGWGQCLAALVAAQKLNGDGQLPVHGIVTDGKLWEFGKLTADQFLKNIESYTVDHIAELFGALHAILQSSAAALAGQASL